MVQKEGEKDMAVLTLFLVDDDLLTRISHKRRLEFKSNIKVIGEFSNAQDCIKALARKQPDLILMDLELSGVNGIEACRFIKTNYPKVKIIILTSFEDDSKVLASLSQGANGYAVKGRCDIGKVIDIVMNGGFWIDSKLACHAFSKIVTPSFSNLEALEMHCLLREKLTQRELEVLKLITEGKTNTEIAQEIVVSTNTIKAHVGSILEKLEAADRVQAAVIAIRANLF
ncbi:MAG: response regulator transcription factor [Candidatus Gastranaerophilales bacterium]|nr:response regulator transcription factor [Candidatus Gastranaerophilales bacterium]